MAFYATRIAVSSVSTPPKQGRPDYLPTCCVASSFMASEQPNLETITLHDHDPVTKQTTVCGRIIHAKKWPTAEVLRSMAA